MKLDHIAYRVSDRKAAADFICAAFSFSVVDEFDLSFDDGSTTKCIALSSDVHEHDVFISDGSPDSIVGRWVAARAGTGGVHHIAYHVDDVTTTMNEWVSMGLAKFTSASPLVCDEIEQVFTDPCPLTDIVYELIHRNNVLGFCAANVKKLMLSSDETRQ